MQGNHICITVVYATNSYPSNQILVAFVSQSIIRYQNLFAGTLFFICSQVTLPKSMFIK